MRELLVSFGISHSTAFFLRVTEILFAFSILVQVFEFIFAALRLDVFWIFLGKKATLPYWALVSGVVVSCVLLFLGVWTFAAVGIIFVYLIAMVLLFRGPFNGGADYMTFNVCVCLFLSEGANFFSGSEFGNFIVAGALLYIGVQSVLSYLIAGWVKFKSIDWWRGETLKQVLYQSQYSVSRLAKVKSQGIIQAVSILVLVFEVVFPVIFLFRRWFPAPGTALLVLSFLFFAFFFHLLNALFLGLNRFTFAWLATYPGIVFLVFSF